MPMGKLKCSKHLWASCTKSHSALVDTGLRMNELGPPTSIRFHLMLFTSIVNIGDEIAHEATQRLPLVAPRTAPLDWLPLTLPTVLMCVAHISTISQKGNCTSARVVRWSLSFSDEPQACELTAPSLPPLYCWG